MLVSAVPDPSAFDMKYFDKLYRIQAEDFLKGIEANGLLIVDSDGKIQNAILKQIKSLPIKYRQQLQVKIEELLLKKKTKRIIAITTSPNSTSPSDLLGLAYRLKTDTDADAVIVGEDSMKTPKSQQKHGTDIVPLSDY